MDTLNALHYAKWWTPQWVDAVGKGLILKRDFEGGQMARDMTVYVDDDGKAYHIFASEENLTLHIAELSDDYLSHTGKYVRVAPAGQNEAPAIFKKGTLFLPHIFPMPYVRFRELCPMSFRLIVPVPLLEIMIHGLSGLPGLHGHLLDGDYQ